mgnify:CR=1 FL=1
MSQSAGADVVTVSLPTRERGLKYHCPIDDLRLNLSLPTRERGLKSPFTAVVTVLKPSLPTRERGLKYY